jgi:arylsulfatase A-like enzyme
MRGLLPIALVGCHAQRIHDVEQRVATLKIEVKALTEEAAALRAELDARPPPTAAVRRDHDPEGFDPARPLPAGDPARPDVILLSIDTLRADHLGTYGYERDTSPFIDGLAETGTVYEQAWSPTSWTLPSHTTMLSSWLPIHHGAIDDHLKIPNDVPLLPELFRKSGYKTAAVVSTLFVSSRFGFERGFDSFEDFGIRSKQENNLSTVDADHVFHNALHWAQQQPDGKPIFLFLHVYDVHYGYDPPPPWNEKFDRKPQWGDEVYKHYGAYKKRMVPKVQLEHQIAQYDEEIAYVDAELRTFVDGWRASGREVIIAVTADHGEEFGERGSWGHAHTLWPEQLHVPLILNGPAIPSQRLTTRVGTEDIAPTLAGLAGLSFPARDGLDRTAEIQKGAPLPADHVSGRFADTSRFDSLVYRWHEGSFDLVVDLGLGVRSLCKIDEDRMCETNVYRDHKDQAISMFANLSTWLGEPWKVTGAGRVEAEGGVIFQGVERKNDATEVDVGETFAVHPGDALVTFTPDTGPPLGPWRPLGGTVPGKGCPVGFTGRFVRDSELPKMTNDEVEMLVSLGYQVPEEEERVVGSSGPEPCP